MKRGFSMRLYMMPPIDYFAGCLTKDELINNLTKQTLNDLHFVAETLREVHSFREKALKLAKTCGWDGTYSQEVLYFALPSYDAIETEIAIIWKQISRGATFIASPIELDYLKEHEVI